MTFECKIWYMMVLCLNETWMWNIIYDAFVPWWSFNAKIIYDGFVPCYLLIEWEILYMMALYLDDPWMWKKLFNGIKSWDIIYEIWWFYALMTLGCGMIYIWWFFPRWPSDAKYDIWWLVLCINGTWIWYMIYNGLVTRWPLNAKYYIWRFCSSMIL
jgi:hypothetical protein